MLVLTAMSAIGVVSPTNSPAASSPGPPCSGAPVADGLSAKIAANSAANGSLVVTRTVCLVVPGAVEVGLSADRNFSLHIFDAQGRPVDMFMHRPLLAGHQVALYYGGASTAEDTVVYPEARTLPPGTYTAVAKWHIEFYRYRDRRAVDLTTNPVTFVVTGAK